MKPKKQDEVDLSTLPPLISLLASIKFDCRKDTSLKLTELLKTYVRSFQKNLTREEIVQAAIEKGFYIDPSQAQDKKKDSKIVSEASTELTTQVYGKAINALLGDLILQAKKNKKDMLDGKNIVQDPKAKVDPKKDAKSSKKDPKQVIVEQIIEDKPPEKEYTKNFEQLFLLFDFPSNGDELAQLNQLNSQFNLVLVVKEKIVNWGGVDMGLLNQPGDFEGDLKERMDDFIDQDDDPQAAEVQLTISKVQRSMSARSKEYSEQQREVVKLIRQQRTQTARADGLRNLYIKDIVMELDMDIEQETIKQFAETIIEELCLFSLDQQQYQEWIHPKKIQLLVTKQAIPDQFEQEIQRIQSENVKRVEEEKILLEQQLIAEAAVSKKGSKKEAKKTDDDLLREKQIIEEKRIIEEQREAQIEKALAQQKKMKDKMHLQFYRKQLCNLDSQKLGGAILLEVLLDQIEAEKQQTQSGQPTISLEDQEDANRVQNILDQLNILVEGKSITSSVLASLNSFQNSNQLLESKSTNYKIIVDEADEIEKRSHGVKLNDEQSVPDREKSILSNMCFPGIDRYQMPELPEKSENLRKADKSKLSPFIKVDIYEFERRQMLIKFEEVLKEAEAEQDWYFGDRIYLERHNRNTLSQTIYRALLFDPHILTKYNEKDDNMLLALYFRNPPGRLLRRKWSADWRVLPNLENWINFFKLNDINSRNDLYYDIDYQQIGNFHERSKIMYPTDNSLILATKYQVGDSEFLRYKVVKEGVIFGLLEDKDQNTLFYANFDEGIKLTVQQYSEATYQSDLLESQRQEKPQQAKLKTCFNLTLPDGLVLRFLSTGDVVQKYLEVKTQSRNNQNMLHLYDNAEINHELEIKRIITGQGSVIKYMKDGSIVILYANGNTSVQTRNDTWITTNNKGLRKARRMKDGAEWVLDPIPCAIKTDPESGSLIYIRDDQMMVIKYKDGSQYTQHQDGTKMLVSFSQDSVIVEHIAFCTIRVSLDRVKARTDTIIGLGSTYANVGFENIFERSNDGRIVETWLGDGGRVVAYREKQELPSQKEYKTNTIHILFMRDGAVTKIVDDGEIALITAQERMQLNKKGENRENGQDIDYWLQLFSVPDERKSGVFTVFLDQKTLWTRDEESNLFSISSTGEVIAKISVSLQQNQNSNYERPSTPEIPDGDYVEEENKFLPPPTSWIPPRLFVINNDNTGQEFINDIQLQNYFGIKDKDPLCTQIIDKSVPGILSCTSLSFITQILELQQKKVNHIQAYIPQTLDIVPRTINKQEIPLQQIYTFRNVLKFEPFDKEIRAQHQQQLDKYEIWKREQLKTQSEFGVLQKSEGERDAEFDIQLRILEGRRMDHTTESYDQCKDKQYIQLQQQLTIPKELKLSAVDKVKSQKINKHGSADIQDAFTELQKKGSSQKIKSQKRIVQDKEQKVDGFIEHYFQTQDGIKASKEFPLDTQFNAQSKIKPKIMTEQEYSQYVKTISNHNQTINNDIEIIHSIKDGQSVYPMNQDQQHHSSGNKQLKPIVLKVSVFTQAEIDDEIKDQRRQQQIAQYISQKRKDHNVYGSGRTQNQIKKVPCLLKTNPKSELNQKYILTDSLTDNRMKISSMATRVYQQAPSINDLRNEGMHQTIIKTLDKKNNLDEMIDKRNLMINAELNDKLRKDLTIMPIVVRFGTLKQSGLYQVKVLVKNEDVLAQRLVLKQPQTKFAKVFMRQMGPISLGLVREIFVQLDAQQDINGKFLDEFQIISKHQIYTIPIHALILDSQQYEKLNYDYKKINKKPLQKNYVQELRFDQNNIDEDQVDSQNSDLLPKINYDKNFKIDPYSSKNIKKEQEMSQDDDQ